MSSATYIYPTTAKNISLLMQNIMNVFVKKVENFYLDAINSEVSITFSSVLTPEEEVGLSTMVKIHVDNSSLSNDDMLAVKHIRSYKSVDQNLLTTLNSINEVTFSSTSTINRFFYQIGSSSKFIFIQKPGIYFILAKVGAHLASGASPVKYSFLQWSIGKF